MHRLKRAVWLGLAVATALLVSLVFIRPRLVRHLCQRGDQDFSAKDWHGVERTARIVILVAPHDAEGWILLGDALESLQRYDEQERVCRRAVELAPDSAAA